MAMLVKTARFGVEVMLNSGLVLLAVSSLGFGLSDSVAGALAREIRRDFPWWDFMGTLWLCQKFAIENGHRNSEFSHETWWIFP